MTVTHHENLQLPAEADYELSARMLLIKPDVLRLATDLQRATPGNTPSREAINAAARQFVERFFGYDPDCIASTAEAIATGRMHEEEDW